MSALLISPTNGQREVFIVNYQTALANNLTQNTMRLGHANISIKVTQQAMNFTIQCPTPEYKRDLQDWLVTIMRATMSGGNDLSPTRLLWASQGLDYLGYIMNNQLGVQRFEVGPHLSFSMQLVKDELNTITNDFSTGGAYNGIYDGQVFTEDQFVTPNYWSDPSEQDQRELNRGALSNTGGTVNSTNNGPFSLPSVIQVL